MTLKDILRKYIFIIFIFAKVELCFKNSVLKISTLKFRSSILIIQVQKSQYCICDAVTNIVFLP